MILLNRAINRALQVLKGGRGVSSEKLEEIEAYVEKYLAMLGEEALPRPRIEFRANIVARWLGADAWSPRDPSTTTLLLQKSILGDSRTLERVIAHEIIHHTDFMRMSPSEIEMIKLGVRTRDGHGASFLEKAERINTAMGAGFVTVKSDAEYVKAKNVKPFLMLIVPLSDKKDRFGWAWAMRLSEDGLTNVAQQLAKGARLISATHEQWLGGAKIKRYGGVSVPRDPAIQDELRRLYAEEPEAPIASTLRSWIEAWTSPSG